MISLQKRFPLGLASVAMDVDKFENLQFYEKNAIGLLEVTPLVMDNSAWLVGDEESTRLLLALCKNHQVLTDSVHGFYLSEYGHDLADLDEAVRKKALESNIVLLKAAAAIGARYMVIHLFNERFELPEDETMSIARNVVEELLPVAEQTGVSLAIENLDEKWSVRQINTLLDEFDHPLLGICFDTGHSVLYNRLEEELELCGNRLLGLHVHDNFGQKDDHLAPFRGTIDWDAFASALVKIDYHGPLLFESFNRMENESVEQFIADCRKAYVRLLDLFSKVLTTRK